MPLCFYEVLLPCSFVFHVDYMSYCYASMLVLFNQVGYYIIIGVYG